MGGHKLIDLTSTFGADLHEMLREAARQGPLATDEITGSKVVLRQHDVEALRTIRGWRASVPRCST